MMRRNRHRLPNSWLLAAVLFHLGQMGLGAAESSGDDDQEKHMIAIVAAVRAEEAKYRDIEYLVKITTRAADRQSPERPPDLTLLETRHVVLQGDRILFRKEAHERMLATKAAREEISVFDGDQTRTVVAGNCVNIHLGRFEHPDIYPAHSLPLAHYFVNFPLSVYLGGTEAIHADPKYTRVLRESGTVYDFTRVATHLEGEEMVDGLHCVKIRVDRWHSSGGEPHLQYLWLATERNFFCVKEQVSWPKNEFGGGIDHEMHVDQMREWAPGLWFPMKLTVIGYDREALAQNRQVGGSSTEVTVEKVDLAPHHDHAFFRNVTIPTDLPVFTINDRTLVGSALPEAKDGDLEKSKLAEVVAQVAEQEKRYSDVEVKARVVYRSLDSNQRGEHHVTEASTDEHSILSGSLAYFTSRETHVALAGQRAELLMTWAFDGEWTRTFYHEKSNVRDAQIGASLRKADIGKGEGRDDGVPVYRPHLLIRRSYRNFGPLADLLVSPWLNKLNKEHLRFHYCGTAVVDGHPCIRLRGDVTTGQRDQPGSSIVLFLATDRNHIPVKLERYSGNVAYDAIPVGVSHCGDFREVAPGTWYPFRVSEWSFNSVARLAHGRILLSTRRDYQIESVTMSPKVDHALFHDVIVPEGTTVAVLDEDGSRLGQFDQPQEGVAAITTARFLELRSQQAVTKEVRAKPSKK